MDILNKLEWLTKYGFIDIIFGVGVIGFLGNLIRKSFPKNYNKLHVSISPGGTVSIPPNLVIKDSLQIHLRNAGCVNFYIARAYFQSKQRTWWTIWLWNKPTGLCVHPKSDRIADKKNAFELKFSGQQPQYFTEYEALVRPNHSFCQTTWLALERPVEQNQIDKRSCGVLYIEYAAQNRQGVHRIKV